jgi:hypothetical protein
MASALSLAFSARKALRGSGSMLMRGFAVEFELRSVTVRVTSSSMNFSSFVVRGVSLVERS